MAKEVAPLPVKPFGADLTPSFETKLIGEATGAGKIPGEVPHKVTTGSNECSLGPFIEGEIKIAPTLACDSDKV